MGTTKIQKTIRPKRQWRQQQNNGTQQQKKPLTTTAGATET